MTYKKEQGGTCNHEPEKFHSTVELRDLKNDTAVDAEYCFSCEDIVVAFATKTDILQHAVECMEDLLDDARLYPSIFRDTEEPHDEYHFERMATGQTLQEPLPF